VLHLSFALANPTGLESLFASAGFREIRVHQETREARFDSFAEYWASFETATGSLPQAYRASWTSSPRRPGPGQDSTFRI